MPELRRERDRPLEPRLRFPERLPLPVGATLKGGEWVIAEARGDGVRHLFYSVTGRALRKGVLREYYPPNWTRKQGRLDPLDDPQRFRELRDFFCDAGLRLRDLPSHPGLLTLLDEFAENGTRYSVFESLPGNSLHRILSRYGALNLKQFSPVLEATSATLTHLHEHGLLHRNVTPDTIFITPDGQVKLTDFETLTPFPNARNFPGIVIPNPDYAPLELISTFPRYGPESDVFIFAATTYQALTGKRLPPATHRVGSDSMEPAHLIQPSLSPKVSEVFDRALKLRAPERIPTAAQFVEELQRAASKSILA